MSNIGNDGGVLHFIKATFENLSTWKLKLSLTEVRQVMPTSHLTVTIMAISANIQYDIRKKTHIIMKFSKVGLLKIPLSVPYMWDFAKI